MGAFVFYKAEKDQQWSYFESLYFSYTTLLTIGYGDFEPMSNSGKPFFVFWSLLAVPTLTILISNMGDTVVQWVKDFTIWLGEVTVLPSDHASAWEQFKYGVYQSILGSHAARKRRAEKRANRPPSSSVEDGPHVEEPPGRILGRGVLRRRHRKDKETNERLAADFEKSEAADEQDAKEHGNIPAQDEHHYRRTLLSEIRKVYADSAASQPKQYSYEEWTYYIKLLGQDESDSKYHRLPKPADDAPGSHSHEHHNHPTNSEDNSGPNTLQPVNSCDATDGEGRPLQWSWIGQKSPLMGDKDEPDWLLEKLFLRLEESLQRQIPTNEQAQSSDKSSTVLQNPSPQSISSEQEESRERSRSGAENSGEA
jgi:potassium channel subfamily K, other eukaryote